MAQGFYLDGKFVTGPATPQPTPQATPPVGPPASAPASPSGLSEQQMMELNIAQQRVNAGTPGAPSATNAGDIANLAYAQNRYGWKPTNLADNLPAKDTNVNPNNSAASVIPVGNSTTPTQTIAGTMSAGALTGIEQAMLNYNKQQQDLLAERRAKEEANIAGLTTGLESAYSKSGEQKLRDLNAEFEVKQKQEALTEIQNRMNSYNAALQQGLINIEGQPVALEFQLGQKAALNRQAAATVTAMASQASVIQNQLNFARDQVSQYYTAAQTDRQMEIARYDRLLDLANQKLVNLTNDEKEAINEQKKVLYAANERQQADKDKVIELMLKNPQAWAKSNVNLEMPYEEIAKKIATFNSTLPAAGNYSEFDVNGQVFVLNKDTGEITKGALVPKQSTGGGGGAGFDYNTVLNQLNASRGGDVTSSNPTGQQGMGYVNTDMYKQLRMQAKDKSTFDKNFAHLLNPNDSSAKSLIPKVLSSESLGWNSIDPTTGKSVEQNYLDLGVDQNTIDAAKAANINPSDIFGG